jgi:hypothetical protein
MKIMERNRVPVGQVRRLSIRAGLNLDHMASLAELSK